MATPDGSVVIEVNMNTSQADKDLGKLKKKIEKTESDISDMTTKREKAREKSSLLGASIEGEIRKLEDFKDRLADFRRRAKDKSSLPLVRQNYEEAIPGAKQELEDQRARVKSMQAEWNALETSVERYDTKIAEATAKLEQQKTEAGALQQQINEAAKEYEENIRKSVVSSQDAVDLNRELVSLVQQLNELEEKGITLGYQKYDATISRLAEVESRLRSYQKEITKTQAQEQREQELAQRQMDRAMREAEALSQKMEAAAEKERAAAEEANRLKAIADNAEVSNERIVRLNKELEALKDRQADLTKAGVGAGYQEFDRNAARIMEIKRAIREYQKEMSKPVVPAEDLYNNEALRDAEVSNQHIVDLNRELLELKQKQAALEKSGAGLGYQEYEQNASRISEIKKELKEYQESLGKTSAASEKMNSILGKMISSMASSENAALKSIGTVAGSVVSKVSPALVVAGKVGGVVKSFAGKVSSSMKGILSGFGKASAAVLKFGITAAKAFSRAVMGALALLKKVNVFPKMFSSIGKSFKRLGGIIKSALIFSVIYQGLALVRTQMGAYLRVNTEFSTALRRLQGALLTAFQPIYEVVVPALTSLINILTKAIATVTQFFAALFGKTAKQAQTNAKDLYEQAKATTAAGDAAEEASKQMASFDEINQLRENKSGGGGGGGAGTETGPLFDYEYEDTVFNSWGEAFSAFLDKLLAGIPTLEKALMGYVDRLNNFAKKLYEMFTFPGVLEKVKQLGEDLADMMNRITDAIEWELIGRALGAGLNLALNFLTSFIYRYDWMNLGRHLAEFINGLVDEIDWYEFGRLLWSGFKIGLETLAGFLLGLNMPALAEAASNIVKGFFDEMAKTIQRIPWFTIGTQISEFLNSIDWYGTITSVISAIQAALLALQQMIFGFISTLQWHEIATQIYTAINDSLRKIPWGLLGKTLGDLFIHIFDFLREVIAGINWRQIGEDIAEFLNGIDWISLLSSLAGAIAAGINAAIHALEGLVANLDWARIGKAMGESVNRLVLDIDWESAGKTFSDALNGMITLAINFLETVEWDDVGRSIVTFLENINWRELLVNLGQLVGDAIVAALELFTSDPIGLLEIGADIVAGLLLGIANALLTIGTWIKENLVDPIINAVKNFFGIHSPSTVFAEIGGFLIEGLLHGISEIWQKIPDFIKGKVEELKKNLLDAWENIKTTASEKWTAIKEALGTKFEEIRERAKTKFEEVRQKVSEAWENIKKDIPAKWETVKTALGTAWESIKSTASEKFSGIKQAIIDKMEELKNHDWLNIGTKIMNGIWDGIESIWTSLKSWVDEKLKWIRDAFSSAADSGGGRSGYSSYGGGTGRMLYSAAPVPDISTFHIPALARGAVIPPNREFLAVLGDQKTGTNIEAPLSDIENAVTRAVRAAGGIGGNMTVVLQVEGRELGRAVVKYGGAEYKRIGVNLTEART